MSDIKDILRGTDPRVMDFIDSLVPGLGTWLKQHQELSQPMEESLSISKPVARATRVSSGFGPRGGGMHWGADYAGRHGDNIYAAADGNVLYAGAASGFGNWIVINHKQGDQTFATVYGHMESHQVLVKPGFDVKQGDLIGYVGSAGQSTGPHLHFELHLGKYSDGRAGAVDPEEYIKG